MHSGQKHCCSTTVTHEEAGTSYPTSSAVSCRYSSMPGLSVLHSSSLFPKIYLLFCFLYPFLSSMKKKICFPEKLSFYVITMQRNKTEQQQQQKKKGAPTQTPTQHGQICEHAMKGSQTPRATGLTTCKGKSVEKKN